MIDIGNKTFIDLLHHISKTRCVLQKSDTSAADLKRPKVQYDGPEAPIIPDFLKELIGK